MPPATSNPMAFLNVKRGELEFVDGYMKVVSATNGNRAPLLERVCYGFIIVAAIVVALRSVTASPRPSRANVG